MKSHSVEICPFDHRCRYWAKIIRVDEALPQPVNVAGATDIPGPYLKIGDEELLPGDVLFEGESNHHRRTDRGWTYWISIALESGKLLAIPSGFSTQKIQSGVSLASQVARV